MEGGENVLVAFTDVVAMKSSEAWEILISYPDVIVSIWPWEMWVQD